MINVKSAYKTQESAEIYKDTKQRNRKNRKRKDICIPGNNMQKSKNKADRRKNRKGINLSEL